MEYTMDNITKSTNRSIATNTGTDYKVIYISWQEEEIARLRRQLDDLSTSTSSRIERDVEENIQLQRLTAYLSTENDELANDLLDCSLKEESHRGIISEFCKDKRALVETNKRVIAVRDELADILEKEKEHNPNSLEARQLIQDIRDFCSIEVKLLKEENARLESAMCSQQLKMNSMMKAMIRLTQKDANSELRVIHFEKFVTALQGTVERSVEFNKSLQTFLGCNNDEGMAKSIWHKQHEQLLQVHCALLNEALQIQEQPRAPRAGSLSRPESGRSKSLNHTTPMLTRPTAEEQERSKRGSLQGSKSLTPRLSRAGWSARPESLKRPTAEEQESSIRGSLRGSKSVAFTMPPVEEQERSKSEAYLLGIKRSDKFSKKYDPNFFWPQQRPSAQQDLTILKSVLSFLPSTVTDRFALLLSLKPDFSCHTHADDLLEDFGISNRAKNDDSNMNTKRDSTIKPAETKDYEGNDSISDFF